MREIKCRGQIATGIANAGTWQYWGISGTDLLDAIDPDTIGQYTGLLDKHGVEIYEGDIVRSYNDYWDGCGYLDLDCHFKESEWMFGDYPWCEVSSEKCKVIGNIYQNPELLEVEG